MVEILQKFTEMDTEFDSRYDNIDVESILAHCRKQVPLDLAATSRSMYQGKYFISKT